MKMRSWSLRERGKSLRRREERRRSTRGGIGFREVSLSLWRRDWNSSIRDSHSCGVRGFDAAMAVGGWVVDFGTKPPAKMLSTTTLLALPCGCHQMRFGPDHPNPMDR